MARSLVIDAGRETARSNDPNLRMNLLQAESWTAFLGGDDISLVDWLGERRLTCKRDGAGEAFPAARHARDRTARRFRAGRSCGCVARRIVRPIGQGDAPGAVTSVERQSADRPDRRRHRVATGHGADAAVAAAGRTQGAVVDVLAGFVALRRGDLGSAEASTVRALPMLAAACLASSLIDAFEVLALVHNARGNSVEASRYVGAATNQRRSAGIARSVLQIVTAPGLTMLADAAQTDAEIGNAWVEGATASIDVSVARANRSRGSRRRPTSGWPAVTSTERRVAELAATGLSNSEIAARLFVTAETVKTHLGHLCTELGLRNRAALAAVLLDQPTEPDRWCLGNVRVPRDNPVSPDPVIHRY